jgi:glutamine amidotransferase
MKVGIIDYGLSNLLSISRAIEKIEGHVLILNSVSEIKKVDKLILPGVGAFPQGMKHLNKGEFSEGILEFVKQGKSLLGICLGMQMLLGQSDEISQTKGLNLIPGNCVSLPVNQSDGLPNIVPHVGWETIKIDGKYQALNNQYMYFVHSYFAQPSSSSHVLCTSPFGDFEFASGIQKDNVTGFQFHPEKSGEKGLELLRIFLNN